MPNEVIILKSQRYLYDRSIKAPGANLIQINHTDDLTNAINHKTAMCFYLMNRPDEENVNTKKYIKIAKNNQIPIMCDAATTVPPIKRIKNTIQLGFDLICYSGGKGLRGPYSAGLLLGRKDLIGYARQHGSPNHRAYGRSMKVSAEEYLGMMIAVERSLLHDEKTEYERQLKIIEYMANEISRISGASISIHEPQAEAKEPFLEIRWDERYRMTPDSVKTELREGEPPIEIRALFLSDGQIQLTATMLTGSEAKIVVGRINEIFENNRI
jgi:L-seryl-tRNA(Ser) seleniumtransferase